MILILMFLILMFATVAMISYIIFFNWLSSANKTFKEMTQNMNFDILEKVDEFMNVPLNINKTNQDLIKNDIIDFSDVRAREAFFVNVLGTQRSNIYSFSYGLETGEYYGARRNENYTIEIIRNNADTDFNSWYYAVTKDSTAGELVVKNGAFDPRTRE